MPSTLRPALLLEVTDGEFGRLVEQVGPGRIGVAEQSEPGQHAPDVGHGVAAGVTALELHRRQGTFGPGEPDGGGGRAGGSSQCRKLRVRAGPGSRVVQQTASSHSVVTQRRGSRPNESVTAPCVCVQPRGAVRVVRALRAGLRRRTR